MGGGKTSEASPRMFAPRLARSQRSRRAGSDPEVMTPGGTTAMKSRVVTFAISLMTISGAMATDGPARAQQAPLADPIPRPIPQSHIRISLTPVVTGLTSPVYMTMSQAGDTRMFIVDQTGLI